MGGELVGLGRAGALVGGWKGKGRNKNSACLNGWGTYPAVPCRPRSPTLMWEAGT